MREDGEGRPSKDMFDSTFPEGGPLRWPSMVVFVRDSGSAGGDADERIATITSNFALSAAPQNEAGCRVPPLPAAVGRGLS